VTAGSYTGPAAAGITLNVVITSTQGEGLNSMDLDVILNNNVAGNGTITGYNITTAPTLWAASANTLAPGLDPPGTEIFESVFLNSTTTNVPIGASSILATVTFDMSGVAPGVYAWGVGPNDSSMTAPTTLFATTGEVIPTYIGGTITIAAVPEPSSIVLGLFAAAGMAAVVIRRRRSA
jgi:hypothetical protein